MLFLLTVLLTGWNTLHVSGILRRRHRAIFWFSIVMLAANFFQILYPLLPIYAMGCLVGCCILHVYVLEDEREELQQIIAEEKRHAEAANQAKTAFLFNMSHDIRTPMNAILGYTSLARKKSTEPEINEMLKKIDIAGNQLLSLVNQVLEMSRIESGKIILQEQKIDMEQGAEVVRTVYGEQAKEKRLSLTVEVRDIRHRYIIGDNDRISQITNNLIGNTIKYTPAGGSIHVIAEEILSEAGAEIDTAEDGVFAVEKVENAEPGRYDVVLMDIQMPRMNGYEATAKIRALDDPKCASVKIFAMTANAFAEDRQNALDAGMDGHLTKPIDVEKLLHTLAEIKNA